MPSLPGLLQKHLTLNEIYQFYDDAELALRYFFTHGAFNNHTRFYGCTQREISEQLRLRLDELGQSASLSMLAAIEAAFRMDYLARIHDRKKDPLSRWCRDMYKQYDVRVPLESLIDERINCGLVSKSIARELKDAFKFRHWLAHGRYWIPKLSRRYDYIAISALAESVFNDFSFLS